MLKYLFLFFALSTANVVTGQSQARNELQHLKNINVYSGLPSQHITDVYEDSRGYIWMGTINGLVRFDGRNLDVYMPSECSPLFLKDYISAIYEDSHNNLWIGTHHSFGKFDYKRESILPALDQSQIKQLPSPHITDIIEDKDKNLWITCSNGLFSFSAQTGQLSGWFMSKKKETELRHTYDMFFDTEENFWIASAGRGLFLIDLADSSFTLFEPGKILGDPHFNIIYQICQNEPGVLQLSTRKGIIEMHYSKDDLTATDFDVIHNLNFSSTSSFLHSSSGKFIGNHKGLLTDKFNDGKNTGKQFQAVDNFDNIPVTTLFQSKNKLIWIGTETSGIYLYNPFQPKLSNKMPSINQLKKKNLKSVKSIYEDVDSSIWIGTDGGLIHLNRKGEILKIYTNNSFPDQNLHLGGITSIVRYKDYLLVGSWGGGIAKLNLKLHEIESYQYSPQKRNSIQSMILQDSILWIGTRGRGIGKLNLNNGNTQWYELNSGLKSLIINQLSTINDTLLLAATGKGLSYYHAKEDSFRLFEYKNDTILNQKNIYHVFVSGNQIWLASETGLALVDINKRLVKPYAHQDFFKKYNTYFVFQKKHHLWVNKAYQMFILNLDEEKINHLYIEDGVEEGMEHGIALDSLMLFGGINGFYAYNTNEIHFDSVPPNIVFTTLTLLNKKTKPDEASPLSIPLEETGQVNLLHNQNFIQIGFSALEFYFPEKIYYKYRMYGLGEDWHDAGNNNIATYANLAPGEYVFEVIATNVDGAWNKKPKQLAIIIKPPFWQTSLFKVLLILILLLVVIFIIRYRTKILRQQKDLLEHKVQLRTMELQKANKSLEAQKEEIKLMSDKIHEVDQYKIKFFTNVSHELRTPLTLIISPLNKALEHPGGSSDLQKHVPLMYRNAKRLLTLINQILDIRKIDQGMMDIHNEPGDIIKFIKDIFQTFEMTVAEKEIAYTFNSKIKKLYVLFDTDKVEKIVQNLLSNAIKHVNIKGKAGIEINAETSAENNHVILNILIHNTGKPIPEEYREYVFDRFYQIEKHKGNSSGSGIGLSLVKELVNLLKGKITLNSDKKYGNVFKVTLPVKTSDSTCKIPRENITYPLKPIQKTLTNTDSPDKTPAENKETILIIDDNEDIREYLEVELSEQYNVIVAEDGIKGIEMGIEHIPSLIISDVMMPKVDGFELVKQLKNRVETSHIPIILLTAKTNDESQITGYNMGADSYVTKPFNLNVLQAQIDLHIQNRKLLRDKFSKELIIAPTQISASSKDAELLQKLIDIVDENMMDSDLTSDYLINKVGISYSVLYKKLKALTGQSIGEFIRTLRIKKAAMYIQDNQHTVSEIIYLTGFQNRSYFYRCFKEQYGCSPTEYAKLNTKN